MSLVLQIILFLLLALAFVQDWKFRAIHWFVFPLIAIDSVLIFFLAQEDWKILGLNLIFVLIVMTVLFFYVSLREQEWTNIFERHFGIGDVLFFISVVPLFGSVNYVLFFISGMIFSGILHGFISLKRENTTIPLAGYLSIYLLLLRGVSYFLETDLFYQNQVL